MAISSINFKPVKANSARHNERIGELDYVYSDLSVNNQSWKEDEIDNRYQQIAQLTKEKTGRSIQQKATPIREAVVNLNASHTLDDLSRLAGKLREGFGIDCFQIHIHRDEGKSRQDLNYHAHMLFDWQDKQTGKSYKLLKGHMSKIQTLVARELGMQRGEMKENSNRERLEAVEYKRQQEEIRVKALQQQVEVLEQKKNKAAFRNTGARKEYEGVQSQISLSEQRSREWAVKGIPEYTSSLRSENKGINRAIELQQETILQLGQDVRSQQERISGFRASDKYRLSQRLEATIRKLETEHATARAYQERIKKLRAAIEQHQKNEKGA